TARDQELPLGRVRAAELEPWQHHQPAAADRAARTSRGPSRHARPTHQRGDAGRGQRDGAQVPAYRRHDADRGRRSRHRHARSELRGIKNYLSGVFVLQNASRGSIINQLRQIELHELPADHLATLVPRINAVTPAEVSEMARKYLPIDDMTLIVVGDLDTVT